MTDIVERLRERASRKWTDAANRSASLFGQAADEIERLRAEVDALRADAANWKALANDAMRIAERGERAASIRAAIDAAMAAQTPDSSAEAPV